MAHPNMPACTPLRRHMETWVPVAATERDLLAALARHNVTPLTPMGEKFDPNMHEAMFEAPGTGQASGTIIDIVEAGYMMEERLLRPAKVGIAKD